MSEMTAGDDQADKASPGRNEGGERRPALPFEQRRMNLEDVVKDEHPDHDETKVHAIDKTFLSTFFSVMVVVNVAVIGLDTDLRAKKAGPAAMTFLFLLEALFFIIFGAELVMRMHADRCPLFFKKRWNWLDLGLVSTSGMGLVFELFLAPDEEAAGGEPVASGDNLRIVRVLKFTRVARLIRLVRVFRYKAFFRAARGLILMLYAIQGALKSLGWTAFLFVCCCYLGAIVTTEFLGLQNFDEDLLIQEWYGDMFKSMFTLLQLSTLEGWSEITRHTSDRFGTIWTVMGIMYVMATNMVLMNIVLGSLIENVFSLTAEMRQVQAGEVAADDAESWMKTPSSLASSEDERDLDDIDGDQVVNAPGSIAMPTMMAETSVFGDTRATLLMMTVLV